MRLRMVNFFSAAQSPADRIFRCVCAQYYGWGFRPSAPYVHKFDEILQQLREAGLITKWERDVDEQRSALGRHRRPASRDPARFVAISVYHLQGAFILLAAGYAAGLAALLAELVTHRSRAHAARWRWQRLAHRRRELVSRARPVSAADAEG